MSEIVITEDTLKVHLTTAEKVASVHGDVSVPEVLRRQAAAIALSLPAPVRACCA